MAQVGGTIGIVLGGILLLAAAVIYLEVEDLRETEEKYCEGFIGIFANWDGDCDDLKNQIEILEMAMMGSGCCGLIFLIMGFAELSSAQGKSNEGVTLVQVPTQGIMTVQQPVHTSPQMVMPVSAPAPTFNHHQWAIENIARFGMQCFPHQTNVQWSISEVNSDGVALLVTAVPIPSFGYDWIRFGFDVNNGAPILKSCHVFQNGQWNLLIGS